MNEFLNPKAMVTPGVAGTIAMGIANTLAYSFALPADMTALVISFLFASFSLAASSIAGWQRFVFFVLNGLVIFSVSVGTNVAGQKVGSTVPGNQHARSATLLVPAGADGRSQVNSAIVKALGPDSDGKALHAVTEAVLSSESEAQEVVLANGRHVSFEAEPIDTAWNPWRAGVPKAIAKGAPFAIRVTETTSRPFFGDWFATRSRMDKVWAPVEEPR